ncbi:hypothetical protein [Pseudonocardia nigra]|uniref:hypothetical protein n=1 Tax=Pseudonocardia nigra TaxID=1921578 RepID=UPI001C5D0BB3|nr:hypothetical protein [Pseudonocardia nigra]
MVRRNELPADDSPTTVVPPVSPRSARRALVRRYLPWGVFALVAVVVIGATTAWSASLRGPEEPLLTGAQPNLATPPSLPPISSAPAAPKAEPEPVEPAAEPSEPDVTRAPRREERAPEDPAAAPPPPADVVAPPVVPPPAPGPTETTPVTEEPECTGLFADCEEPADEQATDGQGMGGQPNDATTTPDRMDQDDVEERNQDEVADADGSGPAGTGSAERAGSGAPTGEQTTG